MRKQSLWMMAAILTYSLMMVSCADNIDDNPTNPSDESESENIIEPSVFADLMDIRCISLPRTASRSGN